MKQKILIVCLILSLILCTVSVTLMFIEINNRSKLDDSQTVAEQAEDTSIEDTSIDDSSIEDTSTEDTELSDEIDETVSDSESYVNVAKKESDDKSKAEVHNELSDICNTSVVKEEVKNLQLKGIHAEVMKSSENNYWLHFSNTDAILPVYGMDDPPYASLGDWSFEEMLSSDEEVIKPVIIWTELDEVPEQLSVILEGLEMQQINTGVWTSSWDGVNEIVELRNAYVSSQIAMVNLRELYGEW